MSALGLQPLLFFRFNILHVIQFLIFEVQRLSQVVDFVLFTLLKLNVINSLLKLLVAIIQDFLNRFQLLILKAELLLKIGLDVLLILVDDHEFAGVQLAPQLPLLLDQVQDLGL